VRIVAYITETAPLAQTLNHIGEPAEPLRISPARGRPTRDALAQVRPAYVCDQQVQW